MDFYFVLYIFQTYKSSYVCLVIEWGNLYFEK